MAKEAKPKRNVYVGGLEEQVNEEIVHAAFVPFGDIVEVRQGLLLLLCCCCCGQHHARWMHRTETCAKEAVEPASRVAARGSMLLLFHLHGVIAAST